MQPFDKITSVAVPLIRDNIDTDAIIPSREMTSVAKTGLAEGLFAGWRYLTVGGRDPDRDFVLNRAEYAGAAILLGGANFGCGSSREHAAWALAEYGIRAIVAPSFNPIFRGNCVRNGILPIELDPVPLSEAAQPLTVALADQTLIDAAGMRWSFEIDPEAKAMLLGGLDAIDLTLAHRAAIAAFRDADRVQRPWVYLSGNER
jgi:3-isopropylmalate/(R)-2-methylmalate dehydratase small subunit